ncbi:hypothetical protein ANO11243_007230 [Dothideomycetidae sp. 11243]|nr:hypothetical protein ANO11243_007230 [fungal sp. No.11243]
MTWSGDEASDSEALSTPPSELQERMDNKDDLQRLAPPMETDYSFPAIAQGTPKRRRASTNLIANEDLQVLLGDRTIGTKFLQKYCCGEGCCMVKKIPVDSNRPGFVAISTPENEAFKALQLKLSSVSLDTLLTNVSDLPPTTMSLEPLTASQASNYTSSVDVHPPDFVQPHAPYEVFSAPLYGARELTKSGAEKRTYHFDIDITDYPEEGGVDFKVGGAIGVCPPNDSDTVEDVFDLLGVPKFLRNKPITLKTQGGRWPTIWGEDMARELTTTRRELLTWCSDLTSAPPTKPLLRLLAEHASAENEKKVLLFLVSAQGQAAFCDLRTGPFITLPQLLRAFPSSKPPLESLFSVLPQLMPRFYSLSNDPYESSAREGTAGRKLIEMAVTVHEKPDWAGKSRTGLGSGFLERTAQRFIAAQEDASAHDSCVRKEQLGLRVPMFRGLMANPLSREFATDGPMMLIGAGVGMAPFRGFILNRLRNANCANKIWLVQGVRDSMLDEIYAGELGDHEKEIKKIVDSKKNQKAAKYVQDEVRLQADIVWFVINAIDGRVFVCGSTKGMGEGVMTALIDVAMEKGNLNHDEATNFWEEKKKSGQYIAETW